MYKVFLISLSLLLSLSIYAQNIPVSKVIGLTVKATVTDIEGNEQVYEQTTQRNLEDVDDKYIVLDFLEGIPYYECHISIGVDEFNREKEIDGVKYIYSGYDYRVITYNLNLVGAKIFGDDHISIKGELDIPDSYHYYPVRELDTGETIELVIHFYPVY